MKRRQLLNAGLTATAIGLPSSSNSLAAALASMDPIDYSRSFLHGKWTENRVRFWVESRTRIIDPEKAAPIDYYQCASCKSENTFAPNDLFHQDNYDFLPIFGPGDGVTFRRKAWSFRRRLIER